MDPKRLAIALLAAVVLAAGATYVIYRKAEAARRSAEAAEIKKLVAANKNLDPGMAVKDEDVSLEEWPVKLAPPTAFTKKEDVVGRSLINPVVKSMPILQSDLAVVGSGIALAAKIPPGMRAVSVPSNEIVGVAGFLFPRSRVDVLATWTPPGGAPLTQTILQDVEVITAGQTIQPDPNGKPQTVNVVTLLLSPEDSEKLTLARANSSIQFVLRSGADTAVVKATPVNWQQLGSPLTAKPAEAPKRKKVEAKVKEAAAPPPRPVYTIEVIQGDKRSLENFVQ
jgi:pilus assembly protein CpaB